MQIHLQVVNQIKLLQLQIQQVAGTNNKNNTSTQNRRNSTSNSTTSNTTSNTSAKSSNANLSNLGIRPNDFSGFTPSKLTYDVTVPNSITQIEIYGTAQDSTSKVSGTGVKELKDGANSFNIIVTATDGTTKTYVINVTKEQASEENKTTEGNGLSSLKVGNLELTPEFNTNVYEYKAKYEGEDNAIDVKAVATDPKYIVDISGNTNLKDGENIITILVTDDDGNNVATYQVTLEKNQGEESTENSENTGLDDNTKKKIIIICSTVILLILIIVIYLIAKRKKRSSAWAEDYMMPFDEDENEGFVDQEIDEKKGQNQDIDKYNSNLPNNNELNENKTEKKPENNKIKYDNIKKEMEKEKAEKNKAKEKFLKEYDDKQDDYRYPRSAKKGRHQGKRFK